MAGPKHESGTDYPTLGHIPPWVADRRVVMRGLDYLATEAEKAAGEIAAQGTRVTVLETRLDERAQDILKNEAEISKNRHEGRSTAGVQVTLVGRADRLETEIKDLKKEMKEQAKELRELSLRSVIAVGGGGVAGGAGVGGIIELVRYLLGT